MATLRKRRESWFARIQWRNEYGQKKEKPVPLKTKSESVAFARLSEVNRVEKYIIDGTIMDIDNYFPWLNEEGHSKVVLFTLKNAIDEWISRRKKMGKNKRTLEINILGLSHFSKIMGKSYPLEAINTEDIDEFVDYLRDRDLSTTSINMHLRTVKAMVRYYWKRERLNKIPLIEQLKVAESDPIYITDDEFQSIMELKWLDRFYKKVFFFYRETGCRLREPFISKLDGNWLDIPNLSKGKRPRSIELNESLIEIYNELIVWHRNCGLVEESKGRHISKMFKKALRVIDADEKKRFHSLRHSFAVRGIVKNVSIYIIQKMMGHASVVTTEKYAKIELKRLKQDFPTINMDYHKPMNYTMEDTHLEDQTSGKYQFIDDRMMN